MKAIFKILTLFLLLVVAVNLHSFAQDTLRPHQLGIVLSGGGAKGLAHIGVLKVLEEAGIHPDYIGGTSMGSIIGGLYAMGYNAEAIEKKVQTIDWEEFLNDKIRRTNLSNEEKEDFDRFILTLPVEKKKILIPSGVKTGQNFSTLLSQMAFHVHHVDDFSKLPVPFLCVATDIETGEAVVLKKGYLPDAIRASMAIPTIFTPVAIDGKLLVDGGLINNFPVSDVKEMGADVIIGVDVAYHIRTKDELKTISSILNQSVFFYGRANNIRNRQLCDILIDPPVSDYNTASFNSADSLIARGERAARLQLPKIIHLLDSLGIKRSPGSRFKIPSNDSIIISEITYSGLEKISRSLIESKLNLPLNTWISFDELNDAIQRAYGTQYFSKITYKITPYGERATLEILVEENSMDLIRLGIHYDSDFKAGLLLNGTFRNKLLEGSKLSLNLQLSENPAFFAKYYINTRKSIDYAASFKASYTKVIGYSGKEKVAQYNYFESVLSFYLQSIIRNNLSTGLGYQLEVNSINKLISPINLGNINDFFVNEYIFLNYDTYDRTFYPRKGTRLNSEAKVVIKINKKGGYNYEDFPTLYLATRFNHIFQLGRRVSFSLGLDGGLTYGDEVPMAYKLYVGGMGGNYRNGMFTFPGLSFMQCIGQNAAILNVGTQYEFFRNHFAKLRVSYGTFNDDINEFLDLRKYVFGFGITYGFNSLVGPLEISLTESNFKDWNNVRLYLCLGFWF